MKQGNDGTSAVVLSGGGAYGAYEVGIMKALFNAKSPATDYTPLEPDIFTGTSVGAVNAAVLVSLRGEDASSAIARLERIWINDITDSPGRCGNGIYRFRVDPLRYLDPDCLLRNPFRAITEFADDSAFLSRDFFNRGIKFLLSSGALEQRAFELFNLSSFISVGPFKQLLEHLVDLESIRKSDKALKIVTANWQTGEARVFENRDMIDMIGYHIILSSAAIPGFFPPHIIDGVSFVDGGLVMNTPLKCAIEAGADQLHVIYLDPDIKNIPLAALQDTISTLEKVYTIMSATITGEDVKTAKRINEGIEVIQRATSGEEPSDADLIAFVRVAGMFEQRLKQGLPYKQLTIHQYRPPDLLGGSLGILDFRPQIISALLERGFNDAVEHNCEVSKCILPNSTRPANSG